MINPCISLGIKAWQIGFEAQSVIALRMLRFAAGGARAEAEASRMVGEKILAAGEAQATATAAAMRGHKKHVVAGWANYPLIAGRYDRSDLSSFNVIPLNAAGSRTPRWASSMIFSATKRVAGSSTNLRPKAPQTLSSASDILAIISGSNGSPARKGRIVMDHLRVIQSYSWRVGRALSFDTWQKPKSQPSVDCVNWIKSENGAKRRPAAKIQVPLSD
jgi:hypothetical protein